VNRIDKTLSALRGSGKKMLSPYITAGDPSPEDTVRLMHALVDAGADILELGIPFSDPMAEGPVIQAAMERALAQGIHCDDVFGLIERFREKDKTTPIILMGYVNPVECYGYERFAKRAVEAGADGTILVDMPPEESATVKPIWDKYGLYSIYLCSPTTSDQRMALINDYATGYLYYVSLKGVTGSNDFELDTVKHEYLHRKSQTQLPLMLGFGIKTASMAAAVTKFADGVIVGAGLISAITEAHEANRDIIQAAADLISSMRQAIDNG
jgi:tryptophan synthase alpha chain